MEKDMKFTTAGEWQNDVFVYEYAASALENFQTWWDMNSEERLNFGEEPLGRSEALQMFCAQFGEGLSSDIDKQLKEVSEIRLP